MNKKIKTFIIINTSILMICILIYFGIKASVIQYVPKCFFYETFGLMCPSCGGTRLIVSLFNLEIKKAFLYNPMFFITLIYLIIIDIIYLIGLLLKKEIKVFKWWHLILWGAIIIIFTIIRNIM